MMLCCYATTHAHAWKQTYAYVDIRKRHMKHQRVGMQLQYFNISPSVARIM
jgi:hypothetical protein